MTTTNDDEKFKALLDGIILSINVERGRIVHQTSAKSNTDDDANLNVDIDTVSCNRYEEQRMAELTQKIAVRLNESLSKLNPGFHQFLLNTLFEYHYDHEHSRFKDILTINRLNLFLNDLQTTRDALDAFRAAWIGNVQLVKVFLDKNPVFKDKPGPWGTTLLYSAARNNQLAVVKYLLSEANCSVNAQNRQHIQRALRMDTITASDFKVDPSAGSTALHGACYGGHLEIVKYLIDHDAKYFIRNQAEETPMMNATGRPQIIKYFQDLLNRGYIEEEQSLPENPITEMDKKGRKDCIWEFLPRTFNETWLPFDISEVEKLNELMIVKNNELFQTEYQWNISQTIAMDRFLQLGEILAWVRCRGSSILNFDCYALWQIFYIKHPNVKYDKEGLMPMKILNLSLLDEGEPNIQLKTWYNCDVTNNDRLDEAMNNRQKYTTFLLIDHPVKIDLMNFTFANEAHNISGFIRWIPKLVSNNDQNKHHIVPIDNLQASSNINPVPLTTKYRKEVSQSLFNQGIFDSDDDDDEITIDDNIEIDDGQSKKVENFEDENDLRENLLPLTTDTLNGGIEVNINQYIDKDKANQTTSEQLIRAETSTALEGPDELRQKLVQIETALHIENSKIQTQCDSIGQQHATKQEDSEQTIKAAIEEIERLTTELNLFRKRKETVEQMKKNIQITEYNGIAREVMHDFLLPRFQYFVSQLRAAVPNIDDETLNHILNIEHREMDGTFQLRIQGFPEHHVAFKTIFKRILTLFNCQTSSIEYYERYSNRTLRSISQTFIDVSVRTKSWRKYTEILNRLLHEKTSTYKTNFNHYIRSEATSLTERAIVESSMSPSDELRQLTNTYIAEKPFMNEIEELKYQAMEEFIQQQVISRIANLDKSPRPSSIETLNVFLNRIKDQLRTNPDFIGNAIKHFKLIPDLLKQIMIYYSCFLLQLPLFDESIKLLDMIETNTVTTIATSTGSGKSTLLPALLIAEGYDKVLVTQPRRFPCTSVSERVNQTIKTDINGVSEKLAGWVVSGDKDDLNINPQVLYLTDGLLKESLLNDENFISVNTEVKKATVFFIDEVHERSVNIDLCLALLARLLTIQPMIRTKIKLIISSATLDSSVPQLFQNISGINVRQFQLPQIGLLHRVKTIARPKENVLDIVQELFKKRQRHDQILCFVNSVTEVHQCCRVLEQITQGTIKGYPLIQAQSATVQRSYVEQGSVFFSTTVAETSLTFPSLKYVVDTGMINVSIYDHDKRRTVLRQLRAAESTIKQRLGRVGRTQDGEYYALYDFRVEDQRFPKPQICQLDLSNLEFGLRRSSIRQGLHYMQQFLPDKPKSTDLDATVTELFRLGILEKTFGNDQFSPHGQALAQLPDFGSIAMSKAVLAALIQYHCGRDLIRLSSILSTLNTAGILKDIPSTMKSSDGDFMTLLRVMDEVLLIKQSCSVNEFDWNVVCQHKGLERIQHNLKQAVTRYESLGKIFNKSNHFRQQAQVQSGDWKFIAKALLEGYGDNVFVSMKEIQERTHRFARYRDTTDIAILDLQSTIIRSTISQPPARLVLARDVLYSSAKRSTAVISFVGEMKPSWVQHQLERHFVLTHEEKQHLESQNILTRIRSGITAIANWFQNKPALVLKNQAGIVFNDELELRKELVTTETFQLKNDCKQGSTEHGNLSRNLESVTKMVYIFQPMRWRWEAEKQMKITVDTNPAAKTCVVKVEGRLSEQANVKKQFDRFVRWLKLSVVIRHPNSGVLPRLLHPRLRKKYPHIEKNIARITDVDRTLVDLYKAVKGKGTTRESRMEVVAWIAVCEFHCKLEGGFVRDWVIGNKPYVPPHPKNNPKAWIIYENNEEGQPIIPSIEKSIVPSDLDFHLPLDRYFDIEKFQDRLHKFDIVCKVVPDTWRYVVLVDDDAPTGPFTMDLIEPHVALTHDRIDLDVSNLFLERNYPRELGMRIDVTQSPYLIELESIVENIMEKSFRVLRPIDHFVQRRIDKMINRGWKQKGEAINVNPSPPPRHYSILVPLPSKSTLYQSVATEMKKIDTNIKIIAIDEVRNPLLEDTYEAIKKMIAKECPGSNPNERKLFHGTTIDGSKGILENGFDDRFFNPQGAWGAGAYFADDPRKSHVYTAAEGANQTHVMFYNKVTLGKESVQAQLNKMTSAPKGFHSVKGTAFHYTEYIVYRYGQALPYLKIIYKV